MWDVTEKERALDQGISTRINPNPTVMKIKQSNDPVLCVSLARLRCSANGRIRNARTARSKYQEHSKHDNAQVDAPVHAVACPGHNIFKHVTGLKREKKNGALSLTGRDVIGIILGKRAGSFDSIRLRRRPRLRVAEVAIRRIRQSDSARTNWDYRAMDRDGGILRCG